MKIREMAAKTGCLSCHQLKHLQQHKRDEKTLQICLETIRNQNDFDPLYVLGIVEATYSLPGSIMSLVTSFYAILYSAYQTTIDKAA